MLFLCWLKTNLVFGAETLLLRMREIMIRRIIATVVIIAVIYGGTHWFDKDDKDTDTVAATTTLSVTVVSPEQGSIGKQLNITGMTIPREDIFVITELSGMRVKEVYADVGDVVKKGQKLAVLDGESLRNQLAQLQSDYERASDEFNRVNSLMNTGAMSRESLIQKKTIMQSAQAKLDDAKLNLKRSNIIAADEGIIFERKATIGALINANEPLYRIARHGEIELEANVPESELRNIKIGQEANVKITGMPEILQGKIRVISPRINGENRMANIRITLPHNSPAAVGLFANATINTNEIKGIILPKTAIQQDSNGSFVWKLDEQSKAMPLPVKLVLHSNDSVIVEDIPTDIRIIARAGAFIKEGDIVNVVESK